MTREQLLKNLTPPEGRVDVVLDTDAYNEIDDQFAISYLLHAEEKLTPVRFYAAPFHNEKSSGPEDGMLKSYEEILRLLRLADREDLEECVLEGSPRYLPDENTPVLSPAAQDLSQLAMEYSPEYPLYVVAIGAITNIASALLMNPAIRENMVVVWLGGNARHLSHTREFNMMQDIAAARVVMGSRVPFVQLPCDGVVKQFSVSGAELRHWLSRKNPLADYLAENTIREAEAYAAGTPWTRVIWDVTAVAWLLDTDGKFFSSQVLPVRLPDYTHHYEEKALDIPMRYVDNLSRDALMTDLFRRLTDF
ncbi:MAG: nucleoside hydrolase [Acutalibacter sp.]|nr:nucleoside hydrolase [Acutalibacter sp.]